MNGGAAMVATTGEAENQRVLEIYRVKGAEFTSSYEEEFQAASTALQWIHQQQDIDQDCRVVIATDSQSLCMALEGLNAGADEIRSLMDAVSCKLILQWIPGHSDVIGNDLADQAAKEATRLHGTGRAVSWRGIKPAINRTLKVAPPVHSRTIQVYSKHSALRDKSIVTRKDQVLLARLRSGHHLGLNETKHRYNNFEDPICSRCKLDIDDLEHWLSCAGTAAARMKIFGTVEVDLSALTEFPAKSIALARQTLSLRGAGAPAPRR
jgi:ribonuclease HI